MKVSQTLLEKLGITFVKEARGIAEYKLDSNGLRIILAENHASPVVTVMPLYRVGSRNEAVGFTGATHILEHMMFKGVKNGRTGDIYSFDDVVRPIGGVFNATTWLDRTNYFETVPSEHLESCIAFEADRMRNLVLNDAERASEMTVVRNELERGENEPTRVLMNEAYAFAFREHPYHHPTIGWVSDVENITIERLKQFYNEFYWPDNTTFLLMGDFNSSQALTWIAQYYGVHPKSPKPLPVVHTVESKQEGLRTFTINRPGEAPHVVVAYRIPEAAHADTYALAAAEQVLGGSRKTTRLYKALIEKQLAASVDVAHMQHRDPGLFLVFATVAPGVEPQVVVDTISAELRNLAVKPVSVEELRRAKASYTKSTKLAESDPMRMASSIAEAEAVASWTFYVEYGDKLNAVTPADVSRVAAAYFVEDGCTVGYFIPKKQAETSETEVESDAENSAVSKDTAKTASFAEKTVKVVLDNGLTLLMMPAPGNGVVGISGKLKAASGLLPGAKSLAANMAIGLLTSGSTNRTGEQIANEFEAMGSGVRFSIDDFSTRFGAQVVNSDTSAMLAMIADLLRNPAYPEHDVAVWKMQMLSQFDQLKADTETMASVTLSRTLYGEGSIYAHPDLDDCIAEVKSVSVEDARAFHKSFVSPKGMVLSIVGDFDVAEVTASVKAAFGDWTGSDVKPVVVGEFKMPAQRNRIDVNIPGKANASIVIGHPSSLVRTADDFLAARLANTLFGGGMSARLADAVRVKAGLTYGIYSAFSNVTAGGAPFTIELSVNPINVEKALALIEQVTADFVKNGVSEKEVAIEAKAAAGSFVVNLRSYSAIATMLIEFETNGLGLAGMDDYAAAVQKVTKEQVDAAIRKYIRPESFVTVVAGTLAK